MRRWTDGGQRAEKKDEDVAMRIVGWIWDRLNGLENVHSSQNEGNCNFRDTEALRQQKKQQSAEEAEGAGWRDMERANERTNLVVF